ncbi:MAG: PEP-CTERM sorting domain-containing protein [Armatimonadota bacterium]
MKKVMLTAIVTLSCVALPLIAKADVMVNGDFTVAPANPGAKLVDNWYVTGAQNYVPWDLNTGKAVATALPGSFFLGSNSRMSTLRYLTSQTLPNVTYTLSFDYKAQGSGFAGGGYNGSGDTSTMQLQILDYNGLAGTGGVTVVGVPTTSDIVAATGDVWTKYTAKYTTRADNMSIILKFNVAMGDGNDMPGIEYDQDSFQMDNVSLVPEPGTIFSMLSGLAGLSMMVIRKKSA